MMVVLCFFNVLINAKVTGHKLCLIVADRPHKHVLLTSASMIFWSKVGALQIEHGIVKYPLNYGNASLERGFSINKQLCTVMDM